MLLTPVTGELFRIPLFGFDLLPSDLLIPVILVVWIIDKIRNDRIVRLGRVGKTLLFFVFALIATYLAGFFRFDFHEIVAAGAYLARYLMYLALAFVTFDLLNRDKKGVILKVLVGSMIVSMILICILGFLQLKYFPSFLELGLDAFGWDPHIGRLLSTWFDPNFVGGYLAFILSIVIALALYFRKLKDKKWFWILVVIALLGLISLYFTYSRSGYLALMAALGLLALFKSRKLLVVVVLASLLAFAISPRIQERTSDAIDSGKALFGLDSQRPLDPTAVLRVNSWSYAREIIADHPWVGVGFGRYKFEINQRGYGLLSDHASGGSDSSLLTIWATSGIFGLLSLLAVGFVAAVTAIRRFWKKESLKDYLDAGLVAGFGGMMVHSVFVNSLLYPLIIVYLLMGLGLLDEK